MGIVEVNHSNYQITIRSNIFLYGNAVSETVRFDMQTEINLMWNEPRALVWFNGMPYLTIFFIEVFLKPNLKPAEIFANNNPQNNYIRVEEKAYGNISFVDGLGCNTGYFKLDNLYQGSTTSAHEFGHTMGLPHPIDTDFRGKGTPSIMYPRGTLVDAKFQYDATKKAGETGGTLHPINRIVKQSDIDDLNLKYFLQNNLAVIGSFSSVFHEAHLGNERPL
jgi:Peptidase M66